jgi:putative FmdB family regulatory protein
MTQNSLFPNFAAVLAGIEPSCLIEFTHTRSPEFWVVMPLYEYQCQKCRHRFERIQRFSDAMVEKCPQCGGKVEQMISAPAVQFKGSGWYVTDYAKKSTSASKGESKSESSDGKSDLGKDSGKKESKSKAESTLKSADKNS